jgi:hypothetical protein
VPVDDTIWKWTPSVSLAIRTDFAHEEEWARIQEAIVEPQTEEGFIAYVEFITLTLTHPDRPILAVNLYDWVEGLEDQGRGPRYGDTFRVVPAELWSVQNNLSLPNMEWEEFADNVDGDGIFRGFE